MASNKVFASAGTTKPDSRAHNLGKLIKGIASDKDEKPVKSNMDITERNKTESRLLRLPGEIRNRIYDFALYHGTVHVVEEDAPEAPVWRYYPANPSSKDEKHKSNLRRKSTAPSNLQEVNQLKYVCRQLREETKCIVFQVNKLSFSRQFSDAETCQSSVCSRFLEAVPTGQAAFIPEIFVAERDPELDGLLFDPEGIRRLAEHCTLFSDTKICVELKTFDGRDLCTRGFLYWMFRKDPSKLWEALDQVQSSLSSQEIFSRYENYLGEMEGRWFGYAPSATPFPANLRILPASVPQNCWKKPDITRLPNQTWSRRFANALIPDDDVPSASEAI